MRQIKHYCGYEITDEIIYEMEKIVALSLKPEDKIKVDNMNGVENITCIEGAWPEQIHVILAPDWFMCYIEQPEWQEIEIYYWYSIEKTDNKFNQSIEMLNTFKNIARQYNNFLFKAILRHSTSYPIYEKLWRKGHLYPNDETLFVEQTIDTDTKDRCYEYFESQYEEYFVGDKGLKDIEHIDDFIFHEVSFYVCETFTKRKTKII